MTKKQAAKYINSTPLSMNTWRCEDKRKSKNQRIKITEKRACCSGYQYYYKKEDLDAFLEWQKDRKIVRTTGIIRNRRTVSSELSLTPNLWKINIPEKSVIQLELDEILRRFCKLKQKTKGRWMIAEDAANIFARNAHHLTRWRCFARRKGKKHMVDYVKFDKSIYYPISDVEQFIKQLVEESQIFLENQLYNILDIRKMLENKNIIKKVLVQLKPFMVQFSFNYYRLSDIQKIVEEHNEKEINQVNEGELTSAQAAKMLGMSKNTFKWHRNNALRKGKEPPIPAVECGNKLIYKKSDIEKYIKQEQEAKVSGYLTTTETAHIIGVDMQQVTQWRHSDKRAGKNPRLPYICKDGKYYYKKDNVESFKEGLQL